MRWRGALFGKRAREEEGKSFFLVMKGVGGDCVVALGDIYGWWVEVRSYRGSCKVVESR